MASKWWLLDHFVLFSGLAALAGIVFFLISLTLSLWLAFLKGELTLQSRIYYYICVDLMIFPYVYVFHEMFFKRLEKKIDNFLFEIVHDTVGVATTCASSKEISPEKIVDALSNALSNFPQTVNEVLARRSWNSINSLNSSNSCNSLRSRNCCPLDALLPALHRSGGAPHSPHSIRIRPFRGLARSILISLICEVSRWMSVN